MSPVSCFLKVVWGPGATSEPGTCSQRLRVTPQQDSRASPCLLLIVEQTEPVSSRAPVSCSGNQGWGEKNSVSHPVLLSVCPFTPPLLSPLRAVALAFCWSQVPLRKVRAVCILPSGVCKPCGGLLASVRSSAGAQVGLCHFVTNGSAPLWSGRAPAGTLPGLCHKQPHWRLLGHSVLPARRRSCDSGAGGCARHPSHPLRCVFQVFCQKSPIQRAS